MSNYLEGKDFEAEELTIDGIEVQVDEDKTSGIVDIRFRYVDDITTKFFISQKTGKIAFPDKYLKKAVYNAACRAIKDKLQSTKVIKSPAHKKRYELRKLNFTKK